MQDAWLETLAGRYRLWRTLRTRICDLSDGKLAKVVGRARPIDEPTVGPFTGRALVALRVSGVRVEREGRNQVSRAIDDVERAQTFLVEDDTGVVRVDRAGYSRIFAPTVRITSAFPASEHVERYFARYGQHERTFFDGFGHGQLYDERGIEVGDEVAVLGTARLTHEVGPVTRSAAGYREAPRLFVLEPPPRDRLLASVEASHLR